MSVYDLINDGGVPVSAVRTTTTDADYAALERRMAEIRGNEPVLLCCDVDLSRADPILVHILHHLHRIETAMSEFASDQAHLDADVQAENDAITAIEAEINALKAQAALGAVHDFSGLDAAVSRLKGDAPAPAVVEPAPVVAEPAPVDAPPADPTPVVTDPAPVVDAPAPVDAPVVTDPPAPVDPAPAA